MDPIRPIGPLERDLEPVVRVTKPSPDARRERREPEDRPPRRPRPPAAAPVPPDETDGPSLIDVKV